MKKIKSLVVILCLLVAALLTMDKPLQGSDFTKNDSSSYKLAMKRDLLCLMLAYPEYITTVEQTGDEVYVVLKSGRKLLYDDKKNKAAEVKIAYPDLQDMLEQPYPLEPIKSLMDVNYDPGRVRVYSLLDEVYGASRKQIESNLKSIKIGNGTYRFNANNQAAAALENAMKELIPMSEQRQGIRAFVYPCSGTYNYRVIAGTSRLSPHSYGIAIDLARDDRDYWQWTSREKGEKRLLSYPKEIFELFEANNFIWGGKWGHFDILHFEYRPEIVLKARYFDSLPESTEAWYEGVALEDSDIRNYLKVIDEAIK